MRRALLRHTEQIAAGIIFRFTAKQDTQSGSGERKRMLCFLRFQNRLVFIPSRCAGNPLIP